MNTATPNQMSTRRLLTTLAVWLVMSIVLVGVVVFLPAGSLAYWNGWLFMTALFMSIFIELVLLLRKDRPLLEKRLQMREKERAQKAYVILSLLWFVVSFTLPGFDYRFGWSHVPVWLVSVSVIVMVCGYVLFVTAMNQNSYASRIIEIQPDQQVIDTGLYALVRHPMYMAAIIMYTPCPIVLGSFVALIPVLLLPVLLVYRLLNEEKVLRLHLPGYTEYVKRVRFRLVPGVW